MKTFKQYLEENRLATLAATAGMIAGGAMAAPPKPEAVDYIVDRIKKEEGFRPTAVQDQNAKKNPVVIGYGTTHTYPDTGNPIKIGDTITREQGEKQIRNYIDNMTPKLEKIPGWDEMHPNQQTALISFGYNAGGSFYGAKGYETITDHLKNKEWDKIPSALMLYNKGRDPKDNTKRIELKGLTRRRAEEGNLWSSGMSELNKSQESSKIETPSDVHNVEKGDNLGKIAKKYGKTIEELQKLNPEIKDPNRIKIGQKIKTK